MVNASKDVSIFKRVISWPHVRTISNMYELFPSLISANKRHFKEPIYHLISFDRELWVMRSVHVAIDFEKLATSRYFFCSPSKHVSSKVSKYNQFLQFFNFIFYFCFVCLLLRLMVCFFLILLFFVVVGSFFAFFFFFFFGGGGGGRSVWGEAESRTE